MISAFIQANLNDEWELIIYGIPDDLDYEEKLRDKIKDIKNISLKSSVFGEKKRNSPNHLGQIYYYLKGSIKFIRIRVCKFRFTKFVNKNIQIDKFDEHEGEVTSLEINEISKKILYISMWSNEIRLQKGKKLKRFISDNFHIEKIKEKYLPIYSSLEDNQKNRKNNNLFNFIFKIFFDSVFLNTSISYLFNFMIPTLIMLLVTFAYSKPSGS